jgi:mannose-6-phosphate isomerase-like protein (cupin superfamily)
LEPHQANPQDSATRVVQRRDIPVSSSPEDLGLEVRPFVAHETLSSLLPPSAVSLAWTLAHHGQDVSLRSHSSSGLLIVLEGSATLLGCAPRRVAQGDVVTIPKHHEYGFTAVGVDGLHAIHVTFRDDGEVDGERVSTLEQLIELNEVRAREARSGPFFRLLEGEALDTSAKRTMFREGLRVFSDAFQTMLLTRQAVCRDDMYRSSFEDHFREELGHNTLLKVAGDPRAAMDPVLRATSSWFPHQMLTLDNAGKAVVHLVLETAGEHFHKLATPVFADDECAEYFEMHAEADERHHAMAHRLLEGHNPGTYRRLAGVVDDVWNMFTAMSKRIAELVELEHGRS